MKAVKWMNLRYMELHAGQSWLRAGVDVDDRIAWLTVEVSAFGRVRYLSLGWKRERCGHRHFGVKRDSWRKPEAVS